MKIVLSGYAGVGKSTILEKVKKEYNKKVFICPESAREVDMSKNFYNIPDPDFLFFQKSILDNEIMKLLLIFENNIDNVLFDRSIIDNLTFASIYYNEENINYKDIQKFIDNIRIKNNIDFIYDKKIFINNTSDKEFIKNNILNDALRIKTTSKYVDSFIERASLWRIKYFEILNKIDGLYNELIEVDHFNNNNNFNIEINEILLKSFKKV